MMEPVKIDEWQGAELFRAWGIPDFPDDSPCTFWLWGDCCIFAICANEEGGIDGHMAMDKTRRYKCRDAVEAFLQKFGCVPIRAPILPGRQSVKNLLARFCFAESPPEQVELITGQVCEITFMRRPPYGRHC